MADTCNHAVAGPTTGRGPRRRIGILLFDGVEEPDAVGPWEVLSAWTRQHPDDGWDAFCLSPDGSPVRSARTLMLNALSDLDPMVITDVSSRFVDDGDPVTSAGVSAGIDTALHPVARLTDVERVRAVRREIQYDYLSQI